MQSSVVFAEGVEPDAGGIHTSTSPVARWLHLVLSNRSSRRVSRHINSSDQTQCEPVPACVVTMPSVTQALALALTVGSAASVAACSCAPPADLSECPVADQTAALLVQVQMLPHFKFSIL